MKCFLKKVLLFLLPLAAALCLFEAMLRMIPNDYTYKKKRLRADAKTIEVLFFGSSHVIADINPLFVSPDTFNLAFPTQTPDVDYKLLKRYGEKMENLRCVAIAISDFSLYSRIQDIWANHRLKNYIIYYGFFFDLESVSSKNYFALGSGTIISNFENLLSYYKRNQNFVQVNESGFHPRYRAADDETLEKSGKLWAERHKERSKDRPVDYNGEILADIIAWCAARNIQVFFFTPPVYKTYINHLDEAQLRETIAYIERLARQYDNVTYENFLFEYQDIPEYFLNPSHLNSAGARVFSEQIREILRRRGILDNAD